jgi:bacterioferritin
MLYPEANAMSYDARSDLPYPDIDDVLISEKDVKLLMTVYAGRDSETTSFLTYLYQHYILKPVDEELSETLELFSIVEMIHHDLIGNLIAKMGGSPVFSDNKDFWKGNYVVYAKDIKAIIEHDIELEKKSISDYNNILENIENEVVRTTVERILLDEQIHLKTFEKLRETVNSDLLGNP